MSRIDDLIRELCPNGVRHLILGHVAELASGRVDLGALDLTNYVGVENLMQNCGGRVDAASLPSSSSFTAYFEGDVLIGNIRPYLRKAWLADRNGGTNGDVLVVRVLPNFRDKIDVSFLYYLLSSDRFFQYSTQHAKGAKMPRGDKAATLQYRIPVPPLEVQHEIVRVLDLFQALEAELEAELEARRAQYTHYRDKLLSFPEGGGPVDSDG